MAMYGCGQDGSSNEETGWSLTPTSHRPRVTPTSTPQRSASFMSPPPQTSTPDSQVPQTPGRASGRASAEARAQQPPLQPSKQALLPAMPPPPGLASGPDGEQPGAADPAPMDAKSAQDMAVLVGQPPVLPGATSACAAAELEKRAPQTAAPPQLLPTAMPPPPSLLPAAGTTKPAAALSVASGQDGGQLQEADVAPLGAKAAEDSGPPGPLGVASAPGSKQQAVADPLPGPLGVASAPGSKQQAVADPPPGPLGVASAPGSQQPAAADPPQLDTKAARRLLAKQAAVAGVPGTVTKRPAASPAVAGRSKRVAKDDNSSSLHCKCQILRNTVSCHEPSGPIPVSRNGVWLYDSRACCGGP